ncbi:MAG: hypothetical protein F8N36_13675 [Desulfovibrio sp.]|uniref:hypothetical protein n=1 Tax=Desulfovibrio sp. TaxID=885 RepID=UPI00135DF0B9|nr:hypothetical protein [Desulfovibrio sp.]MTJ93889.1 hypothetical protein [Desulfovibrio sp.]
MNAKLPRPDLPGHHPQNTPLSKWTDGWLKMSVAGHTAPEYIVMHDHEKRDRGWPVTRQEMIDLLVHRGDVPAAGQ